MGLAQSNHIGTPDAIGAAKPYSIGRPYSISFPKPHIIGGGAPIGFGRTPPYGIRQGGPYMDRADVYGRDGPDSSISNHAVSMPIGLKCANPILLIPIGFGGAQ